MSSEVQLSPVSRLLCTLAVSNHSSYLSSYWTSKSDMGITRKVVCFTFLYVVGSVEHLLSFALKILTFATTLFVTSFILIQSLTCLKNNSEEGRTIRKMHLNACTLILLETVPSAAIDCTGVLCPPLAYCIHRYFQKNLTDPYLKKWGFMDYKLV